MESQSQTVAFSAHDYIRAYGGGGGCSVSSGSVFVPGKSEYVPQFRNHRPSTYKPQLNKPYKPIYEIIFLFAGALLVIFYVVSKMFKLF